MMQKKPIEWVDSPLFSKERQVLSGKALHIPGLRMFGHHSTAHAITALDSHYHKDSFEFTYILHGNVRFSVGERSYPLSGGDLFVTFPDEVHDTGNTPMSLHQMYWFQLDIHDPDGFLYMEEKEAAELIRLLSAIPAHVIKPEAAHSGDLLGYVFSLFCKADRVSCMQGCYLLVSFLYYIVDCANTPRFLITPDIGRVIDYIFQHLPERLSIDELARVALLSESRFKQKFKVQMGTSPRDFINYHKIEASKDMLLEGKSVTDVAMELNFSSSNYFSSVFHRYTCFSPSQYVASMAGAHRLTPGSEDYRRRDAEEAAAKRRAHPRKK